MTQRSDHFEYLVADSFKYILGDENALRSQAGTQYSDVKFKYGDDWYWTEAKLTHNCNLMNPRFFFDDKQWKSVSDTKATSIIVNELNSSHQANTFIQELCEHVKIPWDEITLRRSRNYGEVSLADMTGFLKTRDDKYIIHKEDYNLGEIASLHYTACKSEPVFYLQCADDFYMFGNTNPVGFTNVPQFDGFGPLRVRVALRSRFYEIQAEIKIKEVISSPTSVLKDSKKESPFENIRLCP